MVVAALSSEPATSPALAALSETTSAAADAIPSSLRTGEGMAQTSVLTPTASGNSERLHRPAAPPALYAAMGVLAALDVHSTLRALSAGASETNPAVRGAGGRTGTILAMKALSTAGAIYFTERAWKKNRKGAVVLIAAINGVTAAVVVNNLRNARR
jgi:hypothetical protein